MKGILEALGARTRRFNSALPLPGAPRRPKCLGTAPL